jgi:hypothetical protein
MLVAIGRRWTRIENGVVTLNHGGAGAREKGA